MLGISRMKLLIFLSSSCLLCITFSHGYGKTKSSDKDCLELSDKHFEDDNSLPEKIVELERPSTIDKSKTEKPEPRPDGPLTDASNTAKPNISTTPNPTTTANATTTTSTQKPTMQTTTPNSANTATTAKPSTGRPEKTTVKQVSTTGKPVSTTGKPESTTGKPKWTTGKPESTTREPVSTTKKPVSSTRKPTSTAGKPVLTTGKPESTTAPEGGKDEDDFPNGNVEMNVHSISKSKKAARVRPLAGKIKSYSGFFKTNDAFKSRLFFWFFPAVRENADKAPLIVWLQGHPRTTSLTGLFLENGPYMFTEKGEIVCRKYSWTKAYNVLYLDHDVGCGFSYAESQEAYNSSTLESIAANVHEALENFLTIFNEYENNTLYLAGVYNAAKFIPFIARNIQERNANATCKMNLKGLMIGNGFFDPDIMNSYAEYFYQTGMVDENMKLWVQYYERALLGALLSNQKLKAYDTYQSIFQTVIGINEVTYVDHNIGNGTAFDKLMRNETFQKIIHATGRTYKLPRKEYCCDLLRSISKHLAPIFDSLEVLLYTGQFNLITPYVNIPNFLYRIKSYRTAGYFHAPRQIWRVNNQTTIAGYRKTFGKMSEVLVKNAGHTVGMRQPKAMYHLVRSFIEGKFTESGTKPKK